MSHPFMMAVYQIKKNPARETKRNPDYNLYHGSPVTGITRFDTSRQRFDRLAEGKGIYLAEDREVAKCYGDNIYSVKIKDRIFDATKLENLLKIFQIVKNQTGTNLLGNKVVLNTLKNMVDGRYSILGETGLIWQLELILNNEMPFLTYPEEKINKIIQTVDDILKAIKVMKYLDPTISEKPLYIVRDASAVEIVEEIKKNPCTKKNPADEEFDDVIADDIINLLNHGETINGIARKLRSSPATVKRILKKKGYDIEEIIKTEKARRYTKPNPSKLKQIAPNHYEGQIANQPIVVALDEDRECWIVRCGRKGKEYLHETVDSLHDAKKIVESWLREVTPPPVMANPKEVQGPLEIYYSKEAPEKRYHLRKGKDNQWVVSWEPHIFNTKKFIKKNDAIAYVRNKIGDIKTKKNPENDEYEHDQDVIDLYGHGLTIEKISRRIGISAPKVREILKRNNVKTREGKYPGVDIPLDELKQLFLHTPISIQELAKKYNVSVHAIRNKLAQAEVNVIKINKEKRLKRHREGIDD